MWNFYIIVPFFDALYYLHIPQNTLDSNYEKQFNVNENSQEIEIIDHIE